jgi:O-Antigen ligase
MIDALTSSVAHTESSYSTAERSVIILLPKFLVMLAALSLIVSGALPQLEMAVTGGSLPFLPKAITLLTLGLGSMLLLRGRFQSSPLLPLTIALAAYFACEVLFLHFFKSLSFEDIRSSLDYFIFLLMAGVASVVPLRIKPQSILAFLLVVTFACLVISAAQFLTNSPVVRTESTDHVFHVQSYQFFDQTRGFSLFANGLEAGLFYSFMGAVATGYALQRGTKVFGLILLSLCAFGCYATYTRLAIIGFVLSAFGVYLMSRKRLTRFGLLLPIFSLGCAALVVLQGVRGTDGTGGNDLANKSSLDQRVAAWGVYGGKFLAGSSADILLGIGQGPYIPYSAPNRPDNAAPIPVDNAYLLVLLSSGIAGLAACGFAYWRLWTFLHKRASSTKGPLLIGIAGIFSTVPFFCAINDPPTQIILLLLLAIVLEPEDHGMSELHGPSQGALRLEPRPFYADELKTIA